MNSKATTKKRYLGPCALVFTSGTTGAWRIVRPQVDTELCIRCGICGKYCPTGAVTVNKDKALDGYTVALDYCKGCGICANVCPKKALAMIPERGE